MKKNLAFTLAEILITLTIIGVVAAMTIPNLLADVNQRKYNAASGNFQRKLGEALRVMSAQNTLKGHRTTLSFVNELGKNFKILKVCTTLTDCFPAEFKKTGDSIIETSKLTTAASLGAFYGTETVGVQFADGVRAIVAYNPNYTTQSNGDIVRFSKADKTVEMDTNVLAMLFDVSEDDNNKIEEDIFSLNTNFGSVVECTEVPNSDYCIKVLGTTYSAIDCSTRVTAPTKDTMKYCGSGTNNPDYWAGAQKTCDEMGMKLPDIDILKAIYDASEPGIRPSADDYWSTTLGGTVNGAYSLNFSKGSTSICNHCRDTQKGVLCVK